MKRSILASLFCLTALVLVSFGNKQPEIKSIGDNLYKVKGLHQMSDADQRTVQEIMTRNYDIKDFTTEHEVSRKIGPGQQSIIERTVLKDFFTKNAVIWEGRLSSNDEGTLAKLMEKYSK